MAKKPTIQKTVESINHDEAKRKNIPTAEHQSVIGQEERKPKQVRYPRNTDLDPQFLWRGKDDQDWSDLVVNAPPLYIQEKVHPKALIDDLLRQTKEEEHDAGFATADLFADFDGIPNDVDKTEFYSHEQNWSNRMILGDSLQVMASLAEREGLRGQVQCIYFDPPYGIKFNSNFQWSTTSKDVKDGNAGHITREPEQVKAFRDTWRDGIHSYLTYLRDRLTVARDLLTDSGSIFVQIGDENVHRIRALLDEVFGDENFFSQITVKKLSPLGTSGMANVTDNILWYAKSKPNVKFRPIFESKAKGSESRYDYVELPSGERRKLTPQEDENVDSLPKDWRLYCPQGMLSSGYTPTCIFDFDFKNYPVKKNKKSWRTNRDGIDTLIKANRLVLHGTLPYFVAFYEDNPLSTMSNIWTDSGSASTSYEKIYVVQTSTRQIQKCILMCTDPGDLVLDPTCGSGTTATVSEQWGRRWITIDTSRVALALARARIMGSRYPYYLLADSQEGLIKEAELSGFAPSSKKVFGNIRYGFVCERVPHVMLSSITGNAEIGVIWDRWNNSIPSLLEDFNLANKTSLSEWQIPILPNDTWSDEIKKLHKILRTALDSRQKEIDKSIESKAEFEILHDRPIESKKKVRVAGPFTVESLSPHRMLAINEDDDLVNSNAAKGDENYPKQSFVQMILGNLKSAGVQQAHKEDRITFDSLTPWPGSLICAEGLYRDGSINSTSHNRAAIFIGPEFGTVQRADLVEAAKEAGDAGFDVLISCAFNYEAHATEFNKLGRIPVLKARMNADLHMSEDLKNTGKGNLFVIFGEPDIDLIDEGESKLRIKINGVDVFKPQTGEVISDDADGIACWFIDTDYNEESFFVRHAYFLGANDPYTSLKSSLKAEINSDAWATLNSDISRPFPKPKSGRIAVKVINHLGDEVMKVFKV